MNRLNHSPEGMRDIYGTEYERKMILCEEIKKIFRSYGYQFLQTPALEFLDVFEEDNRRGSSSSFYKLFDREGHTLSLRPDFTPSIARAVSMYYTDEQIPLRLCYKGNVYQNHKNYRGRLNESTEMGVELLNDSSAAADAEIIAMVVDIMKRSGLKDFRVSIGNVAFFRALAAEAALDEDTADELRLLLTQRNQFGAQELLERQEIPDELKAAFLDFFRLFGDVEVLDRAAKISGIPQAREAADRLKEVFRILKLYGCEQYVSFDLGMLSNYSYYTGIIFQALTYGTGDAVIKGGRYDDFVKRFGKDAPAIGFTTRIDEILTAAMRQKSSTVPSGKRVMILYDAGSMETAIRESRTLREQGVPVSVAGLSGDLSEEQFAESLRKQQYTEMILFADGMTRRTDLRE